MDTVEFYTRECSDSFFWHIYTLSEAFYITNFDPEIDLYDLVLMFSGGGEL